MVILCRRKLGQSSAQSGNSPEREREREREGGRGGGGEGGGTPQLLGTGRQEIESGTDLWPASPAEARALGEWHTCTTVMYHSDVPQ